MDAWPPLTAPLAASACAFLVLWDWQRRRHNAGVVDVGWAWGTGLASLWLIVQAGPIGPRTACIAGMCALWSSRLGWHIARRLRGRPEDERYASLRRRAGRHAPLVMGAVFALNALLVPWFSAPAWIAASAPASGLRAVDLLGLLLGLGALAGEAQADAQLRRFQADPASRGGVCRAGWWRYSRHPNYFFEWMYWFAFVALGWGHPAWFLTLAAPATMLFFLLRVTGIPATEAQSLRSRGEAYRAYQRTTSAFVPWPPRG